MISDQPALRQRMVIQSKFGIRDGYYDFSKAYILESVDGILSRLGTDYLDILLLHRPDVLMEPEEVAEAFDQLERSGKVRYFGVSNQNPMQMELLGQTVHQRLILNQLQLSAVHTPVVDSGIAANTLLPSLGELYLQNTLEQYDRGVLPGKTSEPELPQALFEQAAEWTDTALFVVSRYAREEIDHKDQPGDYRLSAAEQKLLHQVMDAFPHVAVILNIGAPIEATDFADQAEAVLLMGHPGMEGGNAAANILCGDAYPSGKLTATYARRYQDWPTANTFGTQKDYEEYQEDIFVGYRYFETIPGAKERVCWPFGFGLGYTSFQLECLGLEKHDAMLRVSVNVVNTGARRGREVVQVYVKRPQGLLSTPAVTLCGFQKTRELMPGEMETVVIEIPRYALASYDDIGVYQKSAWVHIRCLRAFQCLFP